MHWIGGEIGSLGSPKNPLRLDDLQAQEKAPPFSVGVWLGLGMIGGQFEKKTKNWLFRVYRG